MHPFIELCGENVSGAMTSTICDRLQKEKIQALCLRECTITVKDYKKLLKRVDHSYTLRHLSLCVDVVTDYFRVQTLAQTIQQNLSLSGLFLHGSSIGDNGMDVLQKSLLRHPGIVTLDLSDCQLGDCGIEYICQLLPGDKTRHGLRELVLSSNPEITLSGWNKLSVALASGSQLETFCVDYNDLGDSAAACILTAVAGSKTIETLDMECTGVTDVTARLFLQILSNNKLNLKDINLDENDISPETMETIRLRLHGNDLTIDLTIDPVLDNPSDDNHSLATSEPPLDDSNSIFGYGKDSRRNSTVTHQEPHPVGGVINDGNSKATPIVNSRNIIPITDVNKLTKSAVLDQTNGLQVEHSALRSKSMIDIRPTHDSDDMADCKVVTGSCTRIQVTETGPEVHQPSRIQGRTKPPQMLVVPETPSLVSLHTYDKGLTGQEDGEFQPIDKMFVRPTSAPIVEHNQLTVQGIGNSPVRSKPSHQVDVSPIVKLTGNSPKSLSPNTNTRRFSTGSAMLSRETDNDARASLTSCSVRNMSDLHSHTHENDLDIEEL